MAFGDVRRMGRRGEGGERAVQDALSMPGAVAVPGGVSIGGAPGSVGEKSQGSFVDPVVAALVDMPSRAEAEQFTGAKPSFYGVQRPEDWQHVVQREMAAAQLPGGREQLGKLMDVRRQRERGGAGFGMHV